MVNGPGMVCTRESVVNETLTGKSSNIWKTIVRINARQLYRFTKSHPISTSLDATHKLDEHLQRYEHNQDKTENFGRLVMPYFQ